MFENYADNTRHKETILKTYVLLAAAFVGMIAINVYAYITVIKMSEMYTSLNNAAINIKLRTTNANLLFREILSGYSDKDMNAVWDLIKNARKNAGKMSEIGESKELDEKLISYKNATLKCFTGGDGNANKTELKEEYDSAFSAVIDHVDKIEKRLNGLIAGKMLTLKILYSILMINILLLSGFIVLILRKYVLERQITEKELQDTRDDLKTVLNSINSVIISVDSQKCIARWNNAAEKYFGMPSGKVAGKNIWEIVPFLKKFQVDYEKVFQLRKATDFFREKVTVGDAEKYFNIKMNYAPGFDGIVILLDDVTGYEVKEKQIRQAQKMQTLENLIGGLAHDFNNVLGAITGTITMLKYSLENKSGGLDEVKNNMDVIESSAERAVIMVQQILSISQKHELAPANIDLNAVVQHVMKICENTIDKRIELVGEIYDVKAMTNADPALIEQVLLNLCDNAVQAMTIMRKEGEPQEGTLTIAVDKVYPDRAYRALHPQATEQSYWIISVSDNGIGMDSGTAAKIFDPFFTMKENLQAAGLGLTIANDIVRQHKGFIEVESRPDSGSKFSVYLPELYGYVEKKTGEIPQFPEEEKIPTGSGLILVADDELVMRKTAKSILAKLGYEVVLAEDGEQTVNIFRKKHREIKAVLLDMMMPKMSGRDAYIEMKKINPDLKVLLVSGFKRDKKIEEALSLGINGFIQKPYSMITIAQEIKKTITGITPVDGDRQSVSKPVSPSAD